MHGQPSEHKAFFQISDKLTRLIPDMNTMDKLDLKDNYRNATKKTKWFKVAIDQDLI